MKRLLAASSLAALSLAIAGSAALADDYHASGYIGVNIGGSIADWRGGGNDSASGTDLVFGGEGRANVWLSNDMSLQIDAQAEGVPQQSQGYSDADGRIDGIFGAHLSWRDPNSHLIGFFGGLAAASNNDYDGSMTLGIVGVEGQWYCKDWTFYVQGGYEPLLTNSDEYEPVGLGFGRFVARYFVTDNDRLQGEFAYGSAGINNNGTSNSFNDYLWGASWQHRFAGTPFSTTLEYDGFETDQSSTTNYAREQIIKIDFKIHFGEDTLKDDDRQGATLDMPNFDRPAGWAYYTGYPPN